MKAAVLLAVILTTVSVVVPARAQEWAYVYGGVDDPTSPANQWTLEVSKGGTQTTPVWNVDTYLNTKAIKQTYAGGLFFSGARFFENKAGIDSSHRSAVFQTRFKVVGGAATTTDAPVFLRSDYLDGRSRLERRSDTIGGTGNDFSDRDIPAIGLYPFAPFDESWHEYTLVIVGDGEANDGTYAYLDGQFAYFRQPRLAPPAFRTMFGFCSSPPLGYPAAEVWVDYCGWGYDDEPDDEGNLGWFEIISDSGNCTGLTSQTMTDSTKSWATNEFVGDVLMMQSDGDGWCQHPISSNTATQITISEGDLIGEMNRVGNHYRIVKRELGELPPLDPDQVNTANRLLNPEFDSDEGDGTVYKPTAWEIYPAGSTACAVWNSWLYYSKPHQTNRMYGGAVTGDLQSTPWNSYLCQSYTTVSPYDEAGDTYYASIMALTLSEGGDPTNSRVRVGVGVNLSSTDPTDPSNDIQWGDWVSTQGYPWMPARSPALTTAAIGDTLTVFVHMNLQEEYNGKIAMTLVDSAWLHTRQYPWIHNIRYYPTHEDIDNADSFRIEWDTDVPGSSMASYRDVKDSHNPQTQWRAGPDNVTQHYVDLILPHYWNADTLGWEDVAYLWSVKTDQVESYDFPSDTGDIGLIRTEITMRNPVLTGGPTVDPGTATITWDTDVPTTTVVDFRPRGVGDLTVSPWVYEDSTLTTHHVAALTDLGRVTMPEGESPMMPGDMIWFRVRGRNTTVYPAYKYFYSACQSQKDMHTAKFQWSGNLFSGPIGELKKQPDGTVVNYTGKIVTRSFLMWPATFSYIEEPDRSSGVRVNWDTLLSPGDIVDVTGTLQTIDGEKQIFATVLTATPGGTQIAPLGMTNRSIAAVGPGAKAQGLLVATRGRVTWYDADLSGNWYAYVDDGSSCRDGTTHDAGAGPVPNVGIRCYINYPVFGNPYIVVDSGCVGAVSDGGTVVPVVWLDEARTVIAD